MANKEMTLREFCERYRNGVFLREDFYQCKKYSNVMGTPNGVPIAFL